jgi:hypothetical protein
MKKKHIKEEVNINDLQGSTTSTLSNSTSAMLNYNSDLESQLKRLGLIFPLLLAYKFSHSTHVDVPKSHWTVFLPTRGDNGRKPLDEECSNIDRHCFAVVLMAVSLFKGVGRADSVSIVCTDDIPLTDFGIAAALLDLQDEWSKLISRIVPFTSLHDLSLTFGGFKDNNVLVQMRSLILLSHGDATRIRIILDHKLTTLTLQKFQNLVAVLDPHMVHLMCCSAGKLARNLTQKASFSKNCLADRTFFIAYGDDDITTIPYQFAPGLP